MIIVDAEKEISRGGDSRRINAGRGLSADVARVRRRESASGKLDGLDPKIVRRVCGVVIPKEDNVSIPRRRAEDGRRSWDRGRMEHRP